MTNKQIIEKTKDWLWELTEPREEFSGFGICPFLKKELTNDDMKFIILKGQDLWNKLDDWILENKYNSILFICYKFSSPLEIYQWNFREQGWKLDISRQSLDPFSK